jgi:hypothetical protein
MAGYFLKYGGINDIVAMKKELILGDFTSIFDKHYFAEYGIEVPQKESEKNGPFITEIFRDGDKVTLGIKGYPETYDTIDLSDRKNDENQISNDSGKKKIGRNDPCPCGSGKKFKKCCGR